MLKAFASDREKEKAFRERWMHVVDEAQERREKKEAQAQHREAVRRAEEHRATLAKKVAVAEKSFAEGDFPLDLEHITNNSDFEEMPVQSGVPEESLYPPAEKIDRLERSAEAIVITKREGAPARKASKKKKKKKKRTFRAKLRQFSADNIPHRGDGAKETVRKVIRLVSFVALVCGLAYLAVYGVNYLRHRQQTQTFENEISELSDLTVQEEADAWADIRAQYPDVEFPEGMQLKFSKIYAINQEMVGWLRIPNTGISTPLVQTTNNYYYLNHDIFGEKTRYGNPFISYDCKFGKEIGRNTIVYGHNLHDGSIFHALTDYMSVKGYLNAPIVELDTMYESTKWKIFAVMLTNSTEDMNNGYVFQYLYPEFSSDSAFLSKIDEIKARSMIHTGVDVEADDKILTLYTCYLARFSGGRLVVFARQLRPGESEQIDESQVYYDSNAIFPAAYYGKALIRAGR